MSLVHALECFIDGIVEKGEDIDKTTTDCQISLENREAKSCVKLYGKNLRRQALWKISVRVRMPKQRAIYAH